MSVYRPFNFRYATQDVIWPAPPGGQPFFIPAGTRCIYSVFAMHRRTDLWGPDGKHCVCYREPRGLRILWDRVALEFDPDRFLDERVKKYLIPNPFIFLPFNAGPRICLGQQVCLSSLCGTGGLLNSGSPVRVQRDIIHDNPPSASLRGYRLGSSGFPSVPSPT
jgi:hypothetical protein